MPDPELALEQNKAYTWAWSHNKIFKERDYPKKSQGTLVIIVIVE